MVLEFLSHIHLQEIMILNETQYDLTKASLEHFQDSVTEIAAYEPAIDNLNEQLRRQLHLDAAQSQVAILVAEIAVYEQLKTVQVNKFGD